MKTTYTVTEAQARLPRLVRESAEGSAIAITRHGETAAYLISRERLEGMVETLEILSNPEALRAIQDDRQGKTRFRPLGAADE
jgi:prevent-host-death family protein